MRAMTLQDHIDPLVQKIQKCYAPGCGPKSIQVMFTKEGHLWVSEGELCLCLPQSSDKT
jgi:hypothetical protein